MYSIMDNNIFIFKICGQSQIIIVMRIVMKKGDCVNMFVAKMVTAVIVRICRKIMETAPMTRVSQLYKKH